MLIIVPIVFWGCAIFIPFFIRQLMPKYSESNEVLLILLVGNFFMIVNSGLTIPWFVNKQIMARGISNAFGLLITLLLIVFFWYYLDQKDITAVAMAITIGNVIYFIYMVTFVGRQIWTLKQAITILLMVLLCATWTASVVFIGIQYLETNLNFIDDLLQSLKIGGLTFLMIVPIIFIGLRLSDYKKLIKGLD